MGRRRWEIRLVGGLVGSMIGGMDCICDGVHHRWDSGCIYRRLYKGCDVLVVAIMPAQEP